MCFCFGESDKAPKKVNVELGLGAQIGGHQIVGVGWGVGTIPGGTMDEEIVARMARWVIIV